MTKLSRDAQKLLKEITDLGGIETREEWYEESGPYKELLDAGLIQLGSPRGPDRKWKRATATTEE